MGPYTMLSAIEATLDTATYVRPGNAELANWLTNQAREWLVDFGSGLDGDHWPSQVRGGAADATEHRQLFEELASTLDEILAGDHATCLDTDAPCEACMAGRPCGPDCWEESPF